MNDEFNAGAGPVPPVSPVSGEQQEGPSIPPETSSEVQEPEIAGPAGLAEGEESKDDGESAEPLLEEDLPPVNFNLDKQKASTIYNVGIMMAAAEKPLFEKVPVTLIEQVKELFVPPPGYPKTIPPSRTIVVSGPTHSGKFFCSVMLASALRGSQTTEEAAGSILIYSRLRHETAPLIQSISSLKSGSILILEDAFEKNVSDREVASIELARLNSALADRRSFLILTTEVEELKTGAPAISTRNLDLKKIFKSHLLWYLPEDKPTYKAITDLIRRREATLVSLFTSPFQIEYFFRKILARSPLSEKEVQKIAQDAAQVGRQDLGSWFDGLSSHVKMMGLLACLFEGIEKVTVERLFVESVERLRAEGFAWIPDVRELGLREVWSTLRVLTNVSYVHLAQKSIRDELEWQVENRHLLLWAVIQPIAADAPNRTLWREDVRARAVLGAAVGWLGTWDEARFRATQELWARARDFCAREPDNAMGSLPGYAFVESLLSDPNSRRSRVLPILADWIGSRDPDLMWAAGAAIWRLYQTVANMTELELSDKDQAELCRQLIAQLQSLVANSLSLTAATKVKIRAYAEAQIQRSQQNTEPQKEKVAALRKEKEREAKRQLWNCATFALKRIGEVDAQQFVFTLASWFDEDSQVFSWIASRAAQFTFMDLAQRNHEPDTLDAEARLKLVIVVLAKKSAESRVVEAMFNWLEQWLRWDAWKDLITRYLLNISNRGPCTLRSALRSALARYWLGSATEGVLEISRALIDRSYAMDGVLTESPVLGRCLLIVDSGLVHGHGPPKAEDSEAQRQDERREGALRQVLAMVDTLMAEKKMNLTILLLGAQEATERANGSLRLTSDLPLHRLMRPGIQSVAPDGVRLLLLLTAGPVVDLEDGLDAINADYKLVVAAGCDLEVPLGTELLRVGRDLSAQDLEAVEKKLQLICARAQAALDPAGWETLLERLGVNLAELDADPDATLAAWAVQLGEIPVAGGHDPAKKILCALLRLAAADLEACLRIVRPWLMEGTDLERPMAAAAALALFRAVTHAPGIWGGLAPQRTFDELSGPLARSGKDGTDAMLETVERWLVDPALAEVLAGAVENGRCRLLRWAEEAAPHQIAAFQEALAPLHKSVEEVDLGPSGEVLNAAFDRLRVRLAMGRPRPLPLLAAGETYAVIVFDTAARWGPLAARLFKRFNQPQESRKPLLYRLGERWPTWVAGDPDPEPADLSPVGVRLPRLLGPILRELSPTSVSFVVVLAGEMWIDAEDWLSSPWRARILTHRQLADGPLRARWAALPSLPGQEKDEVDLMATYLKQQSLAGARAGA